MNPTLSERLRRRERHRPGQLVEPSSFWVPAEPPTAVAALMQCWAESDAVAPPSPAPCGAPRRSAILELLVWMLLVLIDGALAAVALVRPLSRRPAKAGASRDRRPAGCGFPAPTADLRLEAVP